MTYIVRQKSSGSVHEVTAETAEDAIDKADAWSKDGPVFIVTEDGLELPLDQFRKTVAGSAKFGE